jgi:hypothetical protein
MEKTMGTNLALDDDLIEEARLAAIPPRNRP